MSLPPPQPHNLPSTFHHAGWIIKYSLLTPPPGLNNPQDPESLQTLVFVHGTPWSSIVFQPLAAALLKLGTHRILLWDLAGYGQSMGREGTATSSETETDIPTLPSSGTTSKGASTQTTSKEAPIPTFEGNTSVATQAQILTALLTHLHLNPSKTNPQSPTNTPPAPALLAHDIAGPIALRAHLIHSLPITRLLLFDTNALLPWGDGFYNLGRSSPSVFRDMPAHIHEAIVRAVVRSARCKGAEGDAWEDVLVAPWVGSEDRQEAFVRQIAQAEDGDVGEMVDSGAYGRVSVGRGSDGKGGVTVVWGEGDGWVPRWKMEGLVGMLGEERVGRFVVLEGAGHLGMLDRPGEVEGVVREWLGV